MRALVATVAVAAAALAGCTAPGGSGDGTGPAPLGPLTLASALVPFDACDDLLDYTKEHALELVGPYGLGGHWGVEVTDDAEVAAEADAAGADGAVGDSARSGVDYSGTNVQEAGVDEPDIVKTDGRVLYSAAQGRLFAIDVTAAEPTLLSSTRLPGESWGQELLLDGDRLLVLASAYGVVAPLSDRGEVADAIGPVGGAFARLTLYDVADPASPREVATLTLDGTVVSARMTGGVARVVTRSEPVGLPFVTPAGGGLRAEREATERNREVVRASTADNWLPYYVHTDADGREREGTLVDCDEVSRPAEFAGLGMLSVASVDLEGELVPERTATGVLAGGETVYASHDRLYVGTNRWVDWPALRGRALEEASETFTTELHAFDITDARRARYVGSGEVRGHLLNQWSVSEHDGRLRVATTDGSPWWPASDDEPVSESFVTVFEEGDGELVQVGQVGGLGLDERIYAVRFMGETGYVVTFRQVDPLYTLDLSDPADPRAVGELKILGYSAYLHPVGEDLLLGVGQDADEEGRVQGMQLSLFDVSDPAAPVRLHQHTIADGSSEVEWDHRAFLHWPPTGLLVVPFQTWRWDAEAETDEVSSGALGVTADAAAGFTEIGRVSHVPADVTPEDPGYSELVWPAGIRRSVVVGDRLLTVSDLGVKASDLATLADVGWLRLPPPGR